MTTGVNVTVSALLYTGLPTDTTLPVSSPLRSCLPQVHPRCTSRDTRAEEAPALCHTTSGNLPIVPGLDAAPQRAHCYRSIHVQDVDGVCLALGG